MIESGLPAFSLTGLTGAQPNQCVKSLCVEKVSRDAAVELSWTLEELGVLIGLRVMDLMEGERPRLSKRRTLMRRDIILASEPVLGMARAPRATAYVNRLAGIPREYDDREIEKRIEYAQQHEKEMKEWLLRRQQEQYEKNRAKQEEESRKITREILAAS